MHTNNWNLSILFQVLQLWREDILTHQEVRRCLKLWRDPSGAGKEHFWRTEYPGLSGSQVIPNAGVQWGMVSLQDVVILLLSSRQEESRYSWLCSVPLSEGPSRVTHFFFCSAQLWPRTLLLLY